MSHAADGSAPAGEVTAVDSATMAEGDLEEAVGLLTQLEVCFIPYPTLTLHKDAT